MTFLKQNNKRAQESQGSFGPLADGDYELLVTKGEWRTPAGKTPNANFTMTVRSDVEQAGKGRKIFHSFYISQDPDKVEVSLGFIERFNLALGVPDGVEFDSPEQWVDYVIGKPVKARVGRQTDQNGNETNYNEIRWFNPSEFKQVQEQAAPSGQVAPAAQSTDHSLGQIDINDDDLPF